MESVAEAAREWGVGERQGLSSTLMVEYRQGLCPVARRKWNIFGAF